MKQQKDDAVYEHSRLIRDCTIHDRCEYIEIVSHEPPLEENHVVNIMRTYGRIVRNYENVLILIYLHQYLYNRNEALKTIYDI